MRISGPASGVALERMTGKPLPEPRRAVVRRLLSASGDVLDQALVLWLPGPASATGEDMVELHLHGSSAVVSAVAETLLGIPGVVPAEPGAFTRRAFENGKLDLTEVEGLADLIAAETEVQRRQAMHQMSGALSTLYESWRGRLIRAMAHVEAVIDFPDEDVPDSAAMDVLPEVAALSASIRDHLNDGRRGEIIREGLSVVILGPPNAGKSSLLNALARRDVAIVSAIPGTTRDLIEVPLNLEGHYVLLTDTAGLRTSEDSIEAEGVRRALARASRADLRLWVLGPGQALACATDDASPRVGDILVLSKSDLDCFDPMPQGLGDLCDMPVCRVSVLQSGRRHDDGLGDLLKLLTARAKAMSPGAETAPITRARHRNHLVEVLGALSDAEGHCPHALDLMAEAMRRAAHHLGSITGRIDVEEVLDHVFRDFCIGK